MEKHEKAITKLTVDVQVVLDVLGGWVVARVAVDQRILAALLIDAVKANGVEFSQGARNAHYAGELTEHNRSVTSQAKRMKRETDQQSEW